MILGFKTTYRGEPTHFPERIKAGTKIHSLRVTAGQRWKAGRTIHMATGVRTKDYSQFHQTTCTGTQLIQLNNYSLWTASVNGRILIGDDLVALATNDGFDSVGGFFSWFDPLIEESKKKLHRPLRLTMIHWTDFRY